MHSQGVNVGQNTQKEFCNSAKLLFMASPAPFLCREKERLFAAYGKVAAECIRLHCARTEAVLQGEEFGLLDELAAAEIARENAKYAIIVHQQVHGC